jgi:hypothetical protein
MPKFKASKQGALKVPKHNAQMLAESVSRANAYDAEYGAQLSITAVFNGKVSTKKSGLNLDDAPTLGDCAGYDDEVVTVLPGAGLAAGHATRSALLRQRTDDHVRLRDVGRGQPLLLLGEHGGSVPDRAGAPVLLGRQVAPAERRGRRTREQRAVSGAGRRSTCQRCRDLVGLGLPARRGRRL